MITPYSRQSMLGILQALLNRRRRLYMRLIIKPEDFAAWFNKAIPGAYRSMTAQDVQDMVTSGVIGRYGYYMKLDIETVWPILQYEQLRENRRKKDEILVTSKPS
jgi:hypothetical protein